MNEAKRRAIRQIRVVETFLREWDPIGVIDDSVGDGLPSGEYDDYAPHIVGMLQRGATWEDLAAHLRHCRTKAIGLDPNDAADAAVASRIVDWWRQERDVDPTNVV